MNTTTIIHRSALALAGALVLLTGCKKKEEAPVPVPKAAKALIISAEKNSFEEVTAKLDPGGNLFCYMSTEQALERLSNRVAAASNLLSNLPNIPGTGRQNLGNFLAVLSGVINESGISQVSGLGASSIAREPGFYYSKVVIHHYPGRNAGLIWSLFGREAHPLRQLDMLPESTALAFGSDFDLPLIWKKLRQIYAKLLKGFPKHNWIHRTDRAVGQ